MKAINPRGLLYSPPYAERVVLASINKIKPRKILDFGCGDSRFTSSIKQINKNVSGFDVDADLVNRNKLNHRNIKYYFASPGQKVPVAPRTFDCVTMMGVLEHVLDERKALKEVYRIMKRGGVLYIYGINKGLTSFMDAANIKFAFPVIHKLAYIVIHGRAAYQKEFVSKKNKTMLSDFTYGKRWHTHYSQSDLRRLCRGLFAIKANVYYSFFVPVLYVAEFLYTKIFKTRSLLISRMIESDYHISIGKFSYCFVTQLKRL